LDPFVERKAVSLSKNKDRIVSSRLTSILVHIGWVCVVKLEDATYARIQV
jgi:hypothetical protein